MLRSYRSQWLAILKANPDAGRQQLMEIANFLYLWLRKNDSQWIEEHLPSPHKFASTAPRFDWKNIDLELSAKVEAAAIRLKNSDGRPVRVSITAIIREVGHKSWIESRQHRIPQTAEALSRNLEPLETWGIRLVKWAEECFIQEAICPTRHNLIVRAGLRNRMGMFPRVQRAIDHALDRLRHRIH